MTDRTGTGTGGGSTAARLGREGLGGESFSPSATSNTDLPPTGTGQDRSGDQVKDQAKEQAGQVADTAKEQAAGVAASAQEQAGNVLGEAKDQAVDLYADLKTQLGEQSDAVRDRLAQFLAGVGSELGDMAGAGGGSGYATQVVRQVGDRASSWGSHLSNHDSSDLLDQTRALARRKPATFLLGAALAGIVAGRATRGAKAHHDETTDSTPARTTPSSTTPSATTASATTQSAASQHSTYEVDAIVERTRPVDPHRDVAAPFDPLDPRDPRDPLAPLDSSKSGEYRP